MCLARASLSAKSRVKNIEESEKREKWTPRHAATLACNCKGGKRGNGLAGEKSTAQSPAPFVYAPLLSAIFQAFPLITRGPPLPLSNPTDVLCIQRANSPALSPSERRCSIGLTPARAPFANWRFAGPRETHGK